MAVVMSENILNKKYGLFLELCDRGWFLKVILDCAIEWLVDIAILQLSIIFSIHYFEDSASSVIISYVGSPASLAHSVKIRHLKAYHLCGVCISFKHIIYVLISFINIAEPLCLSVLILLHLKCYG